MRPAHWTTTGLTSATCRVTGRLPSGLPICRPAPAGGSDCMRHLITMTFAIALLAPGAGAAEPAAGLAKEAGSPTLNTATATAAARTTAGKPAEPAKAAPGG